MTKKRPFLKWAGSKYNCIQTICNLLPPGQRLVEPFGGSAVVFMNTNYPSYLVCENNADLVDLYQRVKTDSKEFIDNCQNYFKQEFNDKARYYELREQFNKSPPGALRSALFLYLNRHGFNGLCRYNSKGIYNVPFGLYNKPYFPKTELIDFSQKSQSADFYHQDFRKTFAMAKAGDVIYCDPPYVPATENAKTFRYSSTSFTSDDQIELAELAKKTAEKGIPVIISNHDTEFTRTHYQGAAITSFSVSRTINCVGSLRHPVKELVAVFSPDELNT